MVKEMCFRNLNGHAEVESILNNKSGIMIEISCRKNIKTPLMDIISKAKSLLQHIFQTKDNFTI
ncbi:MAG: hypothetical protein ACJAUJ_000337 [Salibacteraceae bacterium]|jgi:hypothetical protein